MIGKVTTGKSFNGCINYCAKKQGAEIILTNQCFGSRRALIGQFNDVRKLNQRVKKPVWHASLSFSKNDKVNDRIMLDVAKAYAEYFNIEHHQYVAIKHTDTDHPHIHLVVNRINAYNNKTLSDSNNYRKTAEFCRSIEKRFNLEMVESPNRFLHQPVERTDQRKEKIRQLVQQAVQQCSNFPDLSTMLSSNNITVEKGRGIAFIDDKGVRLKGSEMKLPLRKIQQQFERKIDRSLNLNRNIDLTI